MVTVAHKSTLCYSYLTFLHNAVDVVNCYKSQTIQNLNASKQHFRNNNNNKIFCNTFIVKIMLTIMNKITGVVIIK